MLDKHHKLRDRIETLVLCNDSVLPLGGFKTFGRQLESIGQKLRISEAKLIGLTDSVETRAYHIQSYFLAINSSLLRSRIWSEFWGQVNLSGSKNELIQQGEVGLSQWLLRHNIPLEASYSLVSILLNSPIALHELELLDLRQPEQINTTLMCWAALLDSGCPVIKKQLLLEPPSSLAQAVPMAKLKDHLEAVDEGLVKDLERLLQSRFLKP